MRARGTCLLLYPLAGNIRQERSNLYAYWPEKDHASWSGGMSPQVTVTYHCLVPTSNSASKLCGLLQFYAKTPIMATSHLVIPITGDMDITNGGLSVTARYSHTQLPSVDSIMPHAIAAMRWPCACSHVPWQVCYSSPGEAIIYP